LKITLTRRHHLVTEKYGHLDVEATVEVDSEHDNPGGQSFTMYANELVSELVEPAISHLNRSLDEPGNEEFVRAWVNSREV
jgi:hypothetical protein